MLRIVRPNDAGQHPRTRRRPSLSLTAEESARLALVLKNMRRTFSTWRALGDVMRVHPDVLCSIASGRRRGSPGILLQAARIAGLPVERVLSDKLDLAGRCPTCGRST
jgi:hypothetical protein